MTAGPEQIRRIAVLGISGSGKSTFARRLRDKTGLPLYHMDTLYWGPGWTEIPEKEWRTKEDDIISQDRWIIEGYLDGRHTERLVRANAILYLDLPGWACALNGIKRWWTHRNRTRPEMAEGCCEKLDLSYIRTMLKRKERTEIEQGLKNIAPDKIIRLHTTKDMGNYLKAI